VWQLLQELRILTRLVYRRIIEGTQQHQRESKVIGASEKIQIPA
jgi:hypothetical protein